MKHPTRLSIRALLVSIAFAPIVSIVTTTQAHPRLSETCVDQIAEFVVKGSQHFRKLALGTKKFAYLLTVVTSKRRARRAKATRKTRYAIFPQEQGCPILTLSKRVTAKLWNDTAPVEVWEGSHIRREGRHGLGVLFWRRVGHEMPWVVIPTPCNVKHKISAIKLFGGAQQTLRIICYAESGGGGHYDASIRLYHRFKNNRPKKIFDVPIGHGSTEFKAPGWVQVKKRGPRPVLHVATTTGTLQSTKTGGHIGYYTWNPAKKTFVISSQRWRFH